MTKTTARLKTGWRVLLDDGTFGGEDEIIEVPMSAGDMAFARSIKPDCTATEAWLICGANRYGKAFSNAR